MEYYPKNGTVASHAWQHRKAACCLWGVRKNELVNGAKVVIESVVEEECVVKE